MTENQSENFTGKWPALNVIISGELFTERYRSIQALKQNNSGHEFAADRNLETLVTRQINIKMWLLWVKKLQIIYNIKPVSIIMKN